jgi:cytochrome c peroxidase
MIKKLLLLLSVCTAMIANEITPIPLNADVDIFKARLGKKLFMDPRLSSDGTVSCLNCHNLFAGGADTVPFSFGVGGAEGSINSPTVYNAGFNFTQFWNGRAKDLKEQALFPIVNPIEMNNTLENVVATLEGIPEYKMAFETLYSEGVTSDTLADALGEFGMALITPNAPFDRYLRGDKSALDTEEREGYALFVTKGCLACHNGVNIGGSLYHKLGVIIPYDEYESDVEEVDHHKGRYEVTGREQDKEFFKVPTLRNIALTAPYLHEGNIKSLPEVVELMAKHQLGRPMKPDEVKKIVRFLNTLTGEIPDIVLEEQP